MGNALRFGGTMEICGNDPAINMNRVKGIVDSIKTFYPELNVAMPRKDEVWYGFRPCSPDGLPYIGRSKKISNLIFNTGHAMMGVSLAPGSGKTVSQIIENCIEVNSMFDPERFNA
jgi:D-amino-acid dehydrogenase